MERWALYAMRFMYCVYYRHVFQRLSYISTGRGWVVFVVYINKENESMRQKQEFRTFESILATYTVHLLQEELQYPAT